MYIIIIMLGSALTWEHSFSAGSRRVTRSNMRLDGRSSLQPTNRPNKRGRRCKHVNHISASINIKKKEKRKKKKKKKEKKRKEEGPSTQQNFPSHISLAGLYAVRPVRQD